ncbi:MAG: molybdopterin-guanine dinucleotide biosynthesis protein B [Eubacteriales bacterium]|nr:molybdopterin-guanine dinucleotide biosynthesis protein B [Eubacteriales bacterium]
MKVFSIFGISKTGKTASVEAVISELCKRGYSVGSVKDIHFEEFSADHPGTDTFRHKSAGAQMVTARGLHETDVFYPQRLPIGQVLSFYDQDYVVLEGTNEFSGPGIISAKNTEEIDQKMRDRVFAITGRISEEISEYKEIPVINALKDVERLVDLIETTVPDWLGQKEWL